MNGQRRVNRGRYSSNHSGWDAIGLADDLVRRVHDLFTSAQFLVKFDLWNEHQPLGDARSAEIWMCGATALVPWQANEGDEPLT